MCDGGVRDSLWRLCLGGGRLGLCDIVYPGFLCSEGSLLKRGLLDLRVCLSISVELHQNGLWATYK